MNLPSGQDKIPYHALQTKRLCQNCSQNGRQPSRTPKICQEENFDRQQIPNEIHHEGVNTAFNSRDYYGNWSYGRYTYHR